MKFISVCSGIEAASCAWEPLGWQAVAFGEIEPFPSAVLAHRFPNTPNLGDMTRWREWPEDLLAQADVFTGGTPCQAFSVAGSRRSLDDARGNLTLTFCEIADAIDSARSVRGLPPACIVWENVPGVLSTKDNAFGCFLAALAGFDFPLEAPAGKWPRAGVVRGGRRRVAWCVLDAQYFGVAQRRRRVWVVAIPEETVRGAGDWADPAAVLSIGHCMRRDTPTRGEAGEGAAGSTGDGVARCVTAGEMKRQDWETCTMVAQPFAFDTVGTLDARTKGGGFPGTDGAAAGHVVPVAFDTTQITSVANRSSPKPGDPCHPLAAGAHAPAIAFSAKDYGADAADEISPTLRAMGHAGSHANGGGQVDVAVTGDVFHTLRAEGFDASEDGTGRGAGAVAVGFAQNQRDEVRTMAVAGALAAQPGAKQQTYLQAGMAVRRITPRECERLQGFPDDWTLIPWRKKPASECPDGPRYKALGNSWAVPCARWIGARLDAVIGGGA